MPGLTVDKYLSEAGVGYPVDFHYRDELKRHSVDRLKPDFKMDLSAGEKFEAAGLEFFVDRLVEYLATDIEFDEEKKLQFLRLITKYLMIARSKDLRNLEDPRTALNEVRGELSQALEGDVGITFFQQIAAESAGMDGRSPDSANQLPDLNSLRDLLNLSLQVRGLLTQLSVDDLIVERGSFADGKHMLDRALVILNEPEAMRGGFKIKLLGVVSKYLLVAQAHLAGNKDEIRTTRLKKAMAQADMPVRHRGKVFRRAQEYLQIIADLVEEYNSGVEPDGKFNPDLPRVAWSDSRPENGLPINFRHTLVYLIFIRKFLQDRGKKIGADWKEIVENSYILDRNEGSLYKVSARAMFPNMSLNAISGMLGTSGRLLRGTQRGGEVDWFEKLRERLGEDYELVEGVTVKDLADALVT